jgi:hypothetical protein
MKLNNYIKIAASVLSIIAVTFTSCRKEPVLAPGTLHVSFDTLVNPVIQHSCVNISGCHGSDGESPDLSTYQGILSIVKPGNPNKSKLYNVITSKGFVSISMPPKPYKQLPVQDINNITKWILQGASEH